MTGSFSFDVLSDGSLVLTLGECCIQTAAKRAHRQMVAALLGEGAKIDSLAPLAEMLEEFLTATDFPALRREYRELGDGTECKVRLRRGEDGGISWEVTEL